MYMIFDYVNRLNIYETQRKILFWKEFYNDILLSISVAIIKMY